MTVQFPDNAKPVSRGMRSRYQYYSGKPMAKRMLTRCQDECEADVMIMRSQCQGESRRMRSRCQGDREAVVEKAFTRAHAECKYTRTQRVPCELGGNVSRQS